MAGTRTGGDGKSNTEMRRGTAIWCDPDRTGTAVTSGRGGGNVSPSKSIPEDNDEEGDMGIPASATGIPKGSQPTSLNSSHTSEEFLKSKKWRSAQSSTKVEVSLWLGVTRESVLSIDVVGLSRGVVS